MEVMRHRAGPRTDSINEREVKVKEKRATVMILMENIEMKLFAFEAPSQVGQLQESQFNDPDPSPGPEEPYLEHPLVPLNEIVTEPVDKQNPRNTTESPSLTRMENKGPQPPMMKMDNVEIEMEVFPYTGMTEEDLVDRWSRASSTQGAPTPEAPHSPPTKLKWRRSVPEKRGLVVKDVVCLPSGHPRGQELSHIVPWGGERAELEALGLVTRMSIDDSWSAHEMESRLASLFKRRFSSKQGQAVSFTYLKCLQGSRVLFIPDLPPQSDWTGKQVLKITGHGPLYVLCHHDYTETKSDCVADRAQTLKRQELCLDANKDGIHDVNPRDEIRVSRLSTPTVEESFQETLEVDAILRLFREQNMTADVQTHFHVPRSAILSSAFAALKNPSFSFRTTPILHLVGEEDQGHDGSLGEFFRLALLEVQESSLLEGQPGLLLMTYDLVALEERRYFAAGALVGWSLCHGGPGLRCLHPALYQLMCGHNPSLEDFDWREVADADIQVQLQQLLNCGSVQKLSPSQCEWVAGCGLPEIYTAHTKELPSIYACVVEHYIYHRI
ncbi:uncharacterized protein LOC134011248 isoform X2 [Osmerus eperlanus]|uniref:uncharacterized protein LOC134011248 isoform X2 n=1 Tax=Osmerus eperlanus TaxID=29151 RepID=UPI002E134F2E